MYYHSSYNDALTLARNDLPFMLIGEAGSGKTTIVQQVAEELKLEFFCMSMTRQVTLSNLIGYKNIQGDYQSSEVRRAFEFGGLLLLDEIDAADANVLLCFNTIENGFMSFPDGVIKKHKDFRLCATANPQSREYTGRSQLDAATLDRFDKVSLPIDPKLEKKVAGGYASGIVSDVRQILKDWNYNKTVTMRDAIRIKKRKELGMLKDYVENLLENNKDLIKIYDGLKRDEGPVKQEDCDTSDKLYESILKFNGESNE
jgi:MoxR-like ATPase